MIIFLDFVIPNSISREVEFTACSISVTDFKSKDQCSGKSAKFVFLKILIELLTNPFVTLSVEPLSS